MSSGHFNRMRTRICNLLCAANPSGGAFNEGAMEAAIRLRSGYQLQGVLSIIEDAPKQEGEIVRMAVPTMVSTATDPSQINNPRFMKKVIAEHYFDYDDIECVIVLIDPSPKAVGDDEKPSGLITLSTR